MQYNDPYDNNNGNNGQQVNAPPQQYPQQGGNSTFSDNENGLAQPLASKYQDDFDQDIEEAGLLGKSRMGFVRKVYLILLSMMALTVGMSALSMSSINFAIFQWENYWITVTLMILAIFIEIAIFCFRKVAITSPTNYILCAAFTFCFAWQISFICSGYAYDGSDGKDIVFIAAGLTGAITMGLTVYAMTTKSDFTMMGGLLFILCFTFIFAGMFWWIFPGQVANIMYCGLGVILYGMYLIFDTQLIMGGKRFELDYDHYILGALMIYIDIIMIFLYLLQALSR